MSTRRLLGWIAITLVSWLAEIHYAVADLPATIERVKPAIVVVGTYNKTSSPQFGMRGTGFVIGDGNLIATNAHVVPDTLTPEGTALAVYAKSSSGETQLRRARLVATDREHDLAVLRVDGPALPRMTLRSSDSVREGQTIAFTGFPIGGALGFSPVTHRGIVSAVTPIALPTPTANQLNEKIIRQLKGGTFNIFQLDATAYPGNSGSPVFDVDSGEVVGILSMVFIKGTKESLLSQPSGISYAVPANFLMELLATTR